MRGTICPPAGKGQAPRHCLSSRGRATRRHCTGRQPSGAPARHSITHDTAVTDADSHAPRELERRGVLASLAAATALAAVAPPAQALREVSESSSAPTRMMLHAAAASAAMTCVNHVGAASRRHCHPGVRARNQHQHLGAARLRAEPVGDGVQNGAHLNIRRLRQSGVGVMAPPGALQHPSAADAASDAAAAAAAGADPGAAGGVHAGAAGAAGGDLQGAAGPRQEEQCSPRRRSHARGLVAGRRYPPGPHPPHPPCRAIQARPPASSAGSAGLGGGPAARAVQATGARRCGQNLLAVRQYWLGWLATRTCGSCHDAACRCARGVLPPWHCGTCGAAAERLQLEWAVR
jgi:hypothetical protein